MTGSPTAPDRTTIGETAEGLIRNALQMCEAHITLIPVGRAMTLQELAPALNDALADLAGVARLLRAALSKLDGREAAHPQGDQ